ncbi:hypothetical protein KXX16_008148 [Aspergillus fumigatus]|nr:hypothetical protein KXX16_008148 [Aspergillus fumigatus]
MVTPTSKPNSSFSKVYLTKNNYAGRSLHPNAKRPGKGVEESAKEESTQVVESFEVDGDKQIVDNEDITAEPASSPVSSLEDHENEILPGFEYFDSAVGERRRPQRGRKDLRGSESPTLRRKRNADEMAHTAQADAEKEDYVFGWSQSQKKRKQGYAGKKSDGSLWKAQGSTTAPSQSKSSPSSSASESKTGSSSQKTKTRSRKEAVDRAPSFMLLWIRIIRTNISLLLDDSENTELKQSLCPWCKKAVDSDALRKFRAQPKQRIREQQQFCESHQKETAEKEWKERGYPDIDWDTFDERIKCHFDDLESILVPEGNSYYRNVLDTMLKSGKAKNFRLTLAGDALETICCGYYGTRGANKMLQALTARFSRKLRRLAAEDHIVKTAGPVIYAQAVLVPELAVRLVKEDMGVDVDSARQILRESIEIGEKLNFAPNDVVPIPAESENADDIIV